MLVIAALIGIGVLFYLTVPLAGAVWVRSRWRRFRRILFGSRYYPLLTAENARHRYSGERYRFFGTLEAIEDDEIIWLQGQGIRVPVQMRNEEVYILTGHPLAQNSEPGQVLPQRMAWDQIANLAEGTQFFVFGTVLDQAGRHVFGSCKDQKLLVVVYDGEPELFLSWAVWSGRQQNEFWNLLTPISLFIGCLSYLLFTLYLSEFPIQSYWLAVSLTGALLPLLPLFPPGILFYLLYRRLWRSGRKLRADRDILALPLLYFFPLAGGIWEGGRRIIKGLKTAGADLPDRVILPDGKPYHRRTVDAAELAGLAAAGMMLREGSVQPGTERTGGSWGEGFGSPVPTARRTKTPETGHTRLVSGEEPPVSEPRTDRDGAPLYPPDDPMAEFVAVRWDPIRSVVLCQNNAVRKERTAVFSFALSILINAPLVGWLIWQTLGLIR